VEASHPAVSLRLWGDHADHSARAPGGESRADMHRRSSRAIAAIAGRHPGEAVAVVSHGGVIGFFLRGVLGIPFDLRPGFSTPNGAIAAFRYADGRFKLLTWGLTPISRRGRATAFDPA
jgi:broad specificity phosphatase PhoE